MALRSGSGDGGGGGEGDGGDELTSDKKKKHMFNSRNARKEWSGCKIQKRERMFK